MTSIIVFISKMKLLLITILFVIFPVLPSAQAANLAVGHGKTRWGDSPEQTANRLGLKIDKDFKRGQSHADLELGIPDVYQTYRQVKQEGSSLETRYQFVGRRLFEVSIVIDLNSSKHLTDAYTYEILNKIAKKYTPEIEIKSDDPKVSRNDQNRNLLGAINNHLKEQGHHLVVSVREPPVLHSSDNTKLTVTFNNFDVIHESREKLKKDHKRNSGKQAKEDLEKMGILEEL